MNLIESLPATAKSYYYVVIDTLEEEFSEAAPFEHGRWHWRSVVVLVGIGCSAGAFILSLFGSSALMTIMAFAATAILCFAIYFVSRYEEQKRMALLLDDFEEQNGRLEGEVGRLETQNSRYEKTQGEMEKQMAQLTETQAELKGSLSTAKETASALGVTNATLHETLAETKRREEELLAKHDEYVRVNERGAADIAAKISSLRDLDSQCGIKQKELERLAARLHEDAEKLGAVRKEVEQLTAIRESLGRYVAELKEQVETLKQGVTTGAQNQRVLSSLIARVESILQTS